MWRRYGLVALSSLIRKKARLPPVESVKGVYWDERILGAKVSLTRWSSSADPFCPDLFGAHLHTPLALAELA